MHKCFYLQITFIHTPGEQSTSLVWQTAAKIIQHPFMDLCLQSITQHVEGRYQAFLAHCRSGSFKVTVLFPCQRGQPHIKQSVKISQRFSVQCAT